MDLGHMRPICFHNNYGPHPLPFWVVTFRELPLNLRTFEGCSKDSSSLISNIQRLAIMWTYAFLPLTTVPNLLLFSSFNDLLFLKQRRSLIQFVWSKPSDG
ncbi:hypothetical protein AMTRI_Chr12g275250 [Amborella trichopoda]